MANGSITTNAALLDCPQSDMTAVERVNYFPRQLLTADDMFTDQDYFRLKLQRHNRYMHGWGTVCGLLVTAAPTSASAWLAQISPGYALGPYGDEIYVGDSVTLDLSTCGPSTVTNPCQPDSFMGTGNTANTGSILYIAIQYSECMARPVSVPPSGCGCDQTACENSRIRDSFQIQCLTSLPSSYLVPPSTTMLCDFLNKREVPDCPACPSDPWVVLAVVTLPASANTQLASSNIDNYTYRRQIFSTAILQDQVAECCCAPAPTPTPTPTPTPPPAPPTVVVNQNFKPNTTYLQGQQPLTITITFSQPVLPSTITANSFFITGKDATNGTSLGKVTGSISFDDNVVGNPISLTVTFTPGPNAGFFPTNQGNPALYTVNLSGNAPNAILDINNLALDGDKDGQPGGNWAQSFTVGPQPIQ